MSEMKPGRIVEWHQISSILATFHLIPTDGTRFPPFEAGQYIALRRDGCRLTKKVKEGNEVRFVPDLDADGKQKLGPVTHSYSIAAAPFEAERDNYLEFYLVLERESDGALGRFTESLFRIESEGNDRLDYVDRIVGDFTLANRATGFEHVLMVGTGTGLAPFVSMIKQLQYDSRQDVPPARYTLLHTNRTFEELAYHRELLDIEASKSFDFVYVPSVSRPSARDRDDPQLGIGRANNVLRHILGFPPLEPNAVVPELPAERPLELLKNRMDPSRTVVLTCGNPGGMADIEWLAAQTAMRFEKEEW